MALGAGRTATGAGQARATEDRLADQRYRKVRGRAADGSGVREMKNVDSLRELILNLVKVADRYRPRADRTVDDLSMALTAVIRCGGLLSQAKEKCLHGEFLPWLEQIGIHERRAQRYMEVYRNQQYLTNEGQILALSLRDALRLIAEINVGGEKKKKRSGKKPPVRQFKALDVEVAGLD